jgi:hypothetical protein
MNGICDRGSGDHWLRDARHQTSWPELRPLGRRHAGRVSDDSTVSFSNRWKSRENGAKQHRRAVGGSNRALVTKFGRLAAFNRFDHSAHGGSNPPATPKTQQCMVHFRLQLKYSGRLPAVGAQPTVAAVSRPALGSA